MHNPNHPYVDVLLGRGLDGSIADFSMHSVDTVKTRLQDQSFPPKYGNMLHAYQTILREEGMARGLYSGIGPVMTGSVPGTTVYFGTYEFVQRSCIEKKNIDSVAHLTSRLRHAGAICDLAASVIYVPSEVPETRTQLQGRHNNPNCVSGYNYGNSPLALQMIVKYDGFGAFYNGFRAAILRDVPFSSLHFAFYKKLKAASLDRRADEKKPLTLPVEIGIGSLAGGAAGAITTSLDVVKTLLQIQVNPSAPFQERSTSKVLFGDWIKGLFRGIGPRAFWTALQSSGMFVVYEQALVLMEQGCLRTCTV
ncbi:mitochondrial carrier [Basidiobolus meristosporus CBS 931.73]|uniref:Mitochondrial carrier n=1 Tax=Basidiobolus meristosporus CBS 931.73 TaxID=1314790 RepID=A0A1Y1Y458_9FUNG|nr:mitochondrial carrier [Basidiobolus meristosporus CBS 931.73]|eukprot:ORX92763.1 mitochondrial carrier [Basidiobolus meristosporus CBS 931.73]